MSIDDAFGAALSDHLASRPPSELVLEVDDGYRTPAMPASWFFLPPESWSSDEHSLLARAPEGPVLDLGAGAGRHALFFQSRGHDVTAIDSSPGAIEVCRRRGVRDARLQNLTDVPADRRWMTVLLMCGNLGLAGGWDTTRDLLRSLAARCGPGAVLIADSVDPTRLVDDHSVAHRLRNAQAGRHVGQTRLRLHYREMCTPWWDLLNVTADDVEALVADTGWRIEDQIINGVEHYALLYRL